MVEELHEPIQKKEAAREKEKRGLRCYLVHFATCYLNTIVRRGGGLQRQGLNDRPRCVQPTEVRGYF